MRIKNFICEIGHRNTYVFKRDAMCKICHYLRLNLKLGIIRRKSNNFPYEDNEIYQIIKITGSRIGDDLALFLPELKLDNLIIIMAISNVYSYLKLEYYCTNICFFTYLCYSIFLKLLYELPEDFFFRFYKFDYNNIYFNFIITDSRNLIENYLNIRDKYHFRKFLILESKIENYSKKMQRLVQINLKYDYVLPIRQEEQHTEYIQPTKIASFEKLKFRRKPKNQIRYKVKPTVKVLQVQKTENIQPPKIASFEKLKFRRKPKNQIRYKKKREIYIAPPPPIVLLEKKEIIEEKDQFKALFSIDLNNLAISLREKYRNYRNINPIDFIYKYYPEDHYLSLIFCSKHLTSYQNRDVKKNKGIHKWFIESFIKNKAEKRYCDIDTTLSAITYHNLIKYRKTLKRFFLFSGDKDFHLLIETANRLGIETFIIAADEINISSEMRELANNFAYL